MLVGTISVETSEMLSGELKRRGIEHVVLNAKPEHAEREGETIAQAGRKGAVTIATNMAGRGVDIKLGGSPEQHGRATSWSTRGSSPATRATTRSSKALTAELEPQTAAEADEVRELGGLYIIGTERHESRRIDNQLRGRSGRQGDPGESRFFLSAEDDLIRLFAGERIYKILDRLGPVDEEGKEEALEAKMLTKTIEGAQKKVEQQNFLIRKRVLEYDDVMNEQRRDRSTSTAARCSRARTCPTTPARSWSRWSAAWSTSTRPATCSRTGTWASCRPRSSSSGPRRSTSRASPPETTDREDLREMLRRRRARRLRPPRAASSATRSCASSSARSCCS